MGVRIPFDRDVDRRQPPLSPGERVFVLFLLLAFLVGGLLVSESRLPDGPPTPQFECSYEDVLAFELKDPAYDLPAGYTVCLHIDQVRDQPTPEQEADEARG